MSDDHETDKATIKPRDNGPYKVNGLRLLIGADGNPIRVEGRGKGNIALCRCGASESKPFCDGSHRTAGFDTAPRQPGEAHAEIAGAAEEAEIRITAGGPYVVTGNIELTATEWPEGRSSERYELCRCGQSASKPFCDGSHARVGFDDPGLDTTIEGES